MALVDHGDDGETLPRLRKEMVDLKKSLNESVDRVGALEKEKKDAAETISTLEGRVVTLATDKKALNALVISYQKIESDLNSSLAKARKDHVDETGRLETDLAIVREELRLSREETLKSFEDGYQACWARADHHGYAMGDHTFDAYCGDLARDRDGAASSNRGAAKTP